MKKTKGLKATRPICFFDLETTGTDTETARVVEIALVKLYPDGTIKETHTKINPTIPIPEEASEVHGIKDADVLNSPTFKDIAPKLSVFMSECDLAGHNISRYDIPLISNEFSRAGISFPADNQLILDSYALECELAPRTLSGCYLKYTGETLEGAHGALADTRASMSVLIRQCEGEDWTPQSIYERTAGDSADWAGKIKFNSDGVPCWTFGKNFGKPIFEDNAYLKWFVEKGGAPRQTCLVIERLFEMQVANYQAKIEKELEEQESK